MKPTYFVFAAIILAATSGVANADNADPVKAQAALAALKTEVAKLQASQQPKHEADAALEVAQKAMNDNKTAINTSKTELSDAKNTYTTDRKALVDKISQSGGITSNPELAAQLTQMDKDWTALKAKLTDEKGALQRTQSTELTPALKKAKDAKSGADKVHDSASKNTDSRAKDYKKYNCPATNGVFHGTDDATRPDGLTADCKEVRDQVDSGLCKKEDLALLLAQLGIDAKSKDCGPANGQSGGAIAGAGNGIGTAGNPQ